MRYSAPKGVFDILPNTDLPWQNSSNWQYVEKIFNECATQYGYKEVRTPIFESTDLFIRSVGESSDIVNKEMYTFVDKGDRSLTLRPEGTACLMRAYVENKLYAQGDVQKYFYQGPMFRYERPQTGRYRQFHQFGVEALGNPMPEQDAEIIDLALQFSTRLGIKDLKLHINSVGNAESREKYKGALRNFLTPKFDQLSNDSKSRFEKNMLRILDSKDPSDQDLLKGCPIILDYLDPLSKEHFEKLQKLLKALNIDFEINTNLVRGLDYYNKSVFEITSSFIGAQSAILGGGRYDGLVKDFGGPDKPSVGFGCGIERVLLTMQAQNLFVQSDNVPLAYLIPLGENAKETCFTLLSQLRHARINAEMQLISKKLPQALSRASEIGAKYALILGEDELASGLIQIKDLSERMEIRVNIEETLSALSKLNNPETKIITHQNLFGGKS